MNFGYIYCKTYKNDGPLVMSTPHAQIVVFKYFVPNKPSLFGKLDDFKDG